MILEDIKICHVCHGEKLGILRDILIPDLFTDEEVLRDVVRCYECDTLHYIEDGEVRYEFPITNKIPKNIRKEIEKEI
jgi:hypothetical protein